jgi:hypothetical protein
MNLVSTSRVSNYWEKVPVSLRLIIKARLWTAIGAGGVLYLSPIIFHSLDFSAEEIGSGITTAAFAGITTRFSTGWFLDKKHSYKQTIIVACFLSRNHPVLNLVVIPANAAVVIPLPISSAEKSKLWKIIGLKYKTPPAPIAVHNLAFMINLRDTGTFSQ